MPADAVAVDIRFETEPPSRGVGVACPRISWKAGTDERDWVQTGAELRLERDGVVEEARHVGRESHLIAWPFAPLRPREAAALSVRLLRPDGSAGPSSDAVTIVAGFMGDGEWGGTFAGLAHPDQPAQPCIVRLPFDVPEGPTRAFLYATARGVYDAHLNGGAVDTDVLKPGWTPYHLRMIHDFVDVTTLIQTGTNILDLTLAGGWYTEEYGIGIEPVRRYGEQPSVAATLVVEYSDGRTHSFHTDSGCLATPDGPVRSSGIYAGEHYDARCAEGQYDWHPARVERVALVPEARTAPPVRRTQELPVRDVLTTPRGRTLLDFGQNLVGRIRIAVAGERGRVITFRHSEVLEGGELCTRPLRRAEATDRYVLAGTGRETWEPSFTFHGFRYVEVDGWPGEIDPDDIRAVVTHTDMRRTGWFSCSEPLLERLHENAVWGMRGNFLAVPTDCPQRDERMGWTGDLQAFAPAASFLYDCRSFLASWLTDLAAEQENADGIVPCVVPDVLGEQPFAAAGWGDAATIVPTVLHERFGDTAVLETQWRSMSRWVEAVRGIANRAGGENAAELNRDGLWRGGFQFGDWLDPDAPPENPGLAKADPDVVSSLYQLRSATLLADAADHLGHPDAGRLRSEAQGVRAAFARAYVDSEGRILSDAPSVYALSIAFDALDASPRAAAGRRLAELVEAAGYRLGTGFLGTPVLLDALTVTGHHEAAERLMMQRECPSWLYPVTMGATTIWERWDSMRPDGSINPGEMTSFNHYALGAVADWLHRVVAGLAPAEPGYRRILVKPQPLRALAFAQAELNSPYGNARAGWRNLDDTHTIVWTDVPPNTEAEISLPDGTPTFVVGSGHHEWACTRTDMK